MAITAQGPSGNNVALQADDNKNLQVSIAHALPGEKVIVQSITQSTQVETGSCRLQGFFVGSAAANSTICIFDATGTDAASIHGVAIPTFNVYSPPTLNYYNFFGGRVNTGLSIWVVGNVKASLMYEKV